MTPSWRGIRRNARQEHYRWVLDPVDGTRAFITAARMGSLIALEQDGVPLLGILDQPVLGERFIGVNGAAHLVQAGRSTALKTAPALNCLMPFSAPPIRPLFFAAELTAFTRVKEKTRMTRYAGDCYLFAALALASWILSSKRIPCLGRGGADPAVEGAAA